MSLLYAVVLGLVQGLCEFLPVSSSGHLVLLNMIFSTDGNFILLSVFLHVATLLAVLVCFKKEILELIKNPFSKETMKYVAATIPTVLIFLVFKSVMKDSFSGGALPVCFLFTAVVLMACQLISRERTQANVSFFSATVMGFAQGLAIFPGISRSGSTICAGLFMGENREKTTKFSFIMSIPIIIASLFYELIFDGGMTGFEIELLAPTVVSFIVAFVVGIFAIKFMLKIVKKAKYWYFSIYLAVLSALCLFLF